jgi:hypothetical protein
MTSHNSLPYTIPALYLPVPLDPHPHADRMRLDMERWLEDSGLAGVDDHLQRFRQWQIDDMVVRSFQTGDVDKLALVHPFGILAFLADNPSNNDKHLPGFSQGLPGGLSGLTTPQVIELIDDPEVERIVADPVGRAFLQANRRFRVATTQEKYEQHIKRYAEWFRIHAATDQQDAEGYLPNFAEAVQNRAVTTGLLVVGAYTPAAYPELSAELAYSRESSTIWMLAAAVVGLHNDLYSGYGEMDSKRNTIQTAVREFDFSLQQAADYVGELADRMVVEALRRIDALRQRSAPQDLLDCLMVGLTMAATAFAAYKRLMGNRYQAPGMDLSQVDVIFSDSPVACGAPGIAGLDQLWCSPA